MAHALLTALAALASLTAAPDEPPAAPDREHAEVAAPPAAPTRREPHHLQSLASGASLGQGGAAWLATAGYPALSLAYGQGVSEIDDYGGLLQVDWVATELLLAGFWRRQIAHPGDSHLAFRVRAGFFACFGSTWVHDDNRGDTGLQLAGGLAWSIDTVAGVVTLAGDVPFTWTFARGMGWILAPMATAAFEVPISGDLTAGGRAGVGIRGTGGGAPGSGSADRLLLEISALVTWRLF